MAERRRVTPRRTGGTETYCFHTPRHFFVNFLLQSCIEICKESKLFHSGIALSSHQLNAIDLTMAKLSTLAAGLCRPSKVLQRAHQRCPNLCAQNEELAVATGGVKPHYCERCYHGPSWWVGLWSHYPWVPVLFHDPWITWRKVQVAHEFAPREDQNKKFG